MPDGSIAYLSPGAISESAGEPKGKNRIRMTLLWPGSEIHKQKKKIHVCVCVWVHVLIPLLIYLLVHLFIYVLASYYVSIYLSVQLLDGLTG